MSQQKISLILKHMADQAAPGDEINLWPALQARFEASTSINKPKWKGIPMKPQLPHQNRLRLAAFLALAFVVAAGIFLATPQGQAWAQSARTFAARFFHQRDSDLLPTGPTPTAVTPMPLVHASTQNAAPAATPTPPGCDMISNAHCSIAEIQPKVPFPIRQFSRLPQDVYFRGAVMDHQRATLVYGCPAGCLILLSQEPMNEQTAPPWVGASAQVKTVPIQTANGPIQGEYVQGIYSNHTDPSTVTWDSDAQNFMLAWEESGIYHFIQWLMPVNGPAAQKPDESLLIELAQTLTTSTPQALNLSRLASAGDASLAAGFPVKTPADLPKGWNENYFTVEPETGFVCLSYFSDGSMDREHPRLFLRQSISTPPSSLPPSDPKSQNFRQETVAVGGADDGGQYTRGFFIAPKNACGGISEFSAMNEALTWQADGYSFEIFGEVDNFSSFSVTQMDLVRMAESLTGVSTIPKDQPDPGHLWSLAEVEQYTGQHVLSPAVLPETYGFVTGVVTENQILLSYQSTEPTALDTMQSKPRIYLYQCSQTQGAEDPCRQDLAEIPEEAREAVQINGISGVYAKGMAGSSPETNWEKQWYTDDMFHTRRLFWQANGVSFRLEVLFGEGIDQDQMIKIAGSIR